MPTGSFTHASSWPTWPVSSVPPELPIVPTRDREVLVDGLAVGLICAAICVASDRLLFMSVLVPLVLVLRTAVFVRLGSVRLGVEAIFLSLAVVLGGGNDWLSVVHYGVYDYRVPAAWPEVSTIPVWMILFWGLILRLAATLSWWERWQAPTRPLLEPGSAPGLLAQLVLVVATRQAIYRLWDEPVWSWVPFAAALAVYWLLFRPSRRLASFALGVLLLGPMVEVALINLGSLHAYRHGILGGVPIWIALWWVLGVLVWRNVSARLVTTIDASLERARAPQPASLTL